MDMTWSLHFSKEKESHRWAKIFVSSTTQIFWFIYLCLFPLWCSLSSIFFKFQVRFILFTFDRSPFSNDYFYPFYQLFLYWFLTCIMLMLCFDFSILWLESPFYQLLLYWFLPRIMRMIYFDFNILWLETRIRLFFLACDSCLSIRYYPISIYFNWWQENSIFQVITAVQKPNLMKIWHHQHSN